jgi:hypothetical protein
MLHLHGGQEGPISLLAKSTAERGAIVGRPVEGFVGEFVGELRRVLLLLLDLLGHRSSPDEVQRLHTIMGAADAVAALVRAVQGFVDEFVGELDGRDFLALNLVVHGFLVIHGLSPHSGNDAGLTRCRTPPCK